MKKSYLLLIWLIAANSALAQKVSVLGDSYSTYKDYVTPDTNIVWYPNDNKPNDVKNLEDTWVYKFINDNGFKLEKNNSFSGSTICSTGYRKEDYSQRSFVKRMKNLGKPDIVIIFGATNDSWCGAPIGEYEYKHLNKKKLYAFRPAMAKLCKYMKRKYRKKHLFFVLNSELKDEINESVRTITDKYGIQRIELHDIDKQAGHPSIKGMNTIVQQLNEAILPVVRK